VLDVVKAANKSENVLFHSVNIPYPLIDFVYKYGAGRFHAFQITLAKKHEAKAAKIKELETSFGGADNLSLYFLVPGDNFDVFVMDTVNPLSDVDHGPHCEIWHVMVLNPR
jgi:hypothetical protein